MTERPQLQFSAEAVQNYADLPKTLQAKCDKQLGFLLENFRHPSIQTKKYRVDENGRQLWQGRVDRRYRFYFVILADRATRNVIYQIAAITPHPK